MATKKLLIDSLAVREPVVSTGSRTVAPSTLPQLSYVETEQAATAAPPPRVAPTTVRAPVELTAAVQSDAQNAWNAAHSGGALRPLSELSRMGEEYAAYFRLVTALSYPDTVSTMDFLLRESLKGRSAHGDVLTALGMSSDILKIDMPLVNATTTMQAAQSETQARLTELANWRSSGNCLSAEQIAFLRANHVTVSDSEMCAAATSQTTGNGTVTVTSDYTQIAMKQWAALHGVSANDVTAWINGTGPEITSAWVKRSRSGSIIRRFTPLPASDPDRTKGTFIRAVQAGHLSDSWQSLLKVYDYSKMARGVRPAWFEDVFGVIIGTELQYVPPEERATPDAPAFVRTEGETINFAERDRQVAADAAAREAEKKAYNERIRREDITRCLQSNYIAPGGRLVPYDATRETRIHCGVTLGEAESMLGYSLPREGRRGNDGTPVPLETVIPYTPAEQPLPVDAPKTAGDALAETNAEIPFKTKTPATGGAKTGATPIVPGVAPTGTSGGGGGGGGFGGFDAPAPAPAPTATASKEFFGVPLIGWLAMAGLAGVALFGGKK